jgi:hypothetical protein
MLTISPGCRLLRRVQACYKPVALHQSRQRQGEQSPSESGPPQPAVVGTGRIKFPWRIAAKFLLDMKRKAPEHLAQAGTRQLTMMM